jgi:hypothetical protein
METHGKDGGRDMMGLNRLEYGKQCNVLRAVSFTLIDSVGPLVPSSLSLHQYHVLFYPEDGSSGFYHTTQHHIL